LRKITAIGLLLVFSAYHLGYYFIYESLKQQREIFWENRITNSELSGEGFLHRSLPISFPYQYDSKDLINLKLEIEGKVFRVLEYRYEKDTLHITYVKDIREDDINKSFSDWASTLAQKPLSGKADSKLLFSIEKNYLPCSGYYVLSDLAAGRSEPHFIYKKSTFTSFLEVPVPPPRVPVIS
jgi:hypothetical protein